eukprot:408553-Amphidinium_carterae.1
MRRSNGTDQTVPRNGNGGPVLQKCGSSSIQEEMMSGPFTSLGDITRKNGMNMSFNIFARCASHKSGEGA